MSELEPLLLQAANLGLSIKLNDVDQWGVNNSHIVILRDDRELIRTRYDDALIGTLIASLRHVIDELVKENQLNRE